MKLYSNIVKDRIVTLRKHQQELIQEATTVMGRIQEAELVLEYLLKPDAPPLAGPGAEPASSEIGG